MLVEQEALVKAAHELEPLPTTVTRLAQILTRHDWDLRDVEEAISLDQALTPRILRLANSALASRGHPIATVREAVMRVGTGPIFSMAMALCVQKRFARPVAQYGIAEGELWAHSVAAALAVELLGQRHDGKLPVESFTAALLHDVGKLVMARFLEPQYLELLSAAEQQGQLSARAAEVEILGVEHGELGAIVAQHWNLPERLVRGIQYHHAPADCGDPIAYVVHASDVVASLVAAHRDELLPAIDPGVPSREELEFVEQAIDATTCAALKVRFGDVVRLAHVVEARLGEVLERYE